MKTGIHIRPAAPEDGALAASLILSTGPDLFDFVFYRNTQKNLDLIDRLFAEDTNSFSHSCAYMAERGDRPAGLVHVVDYEEKQLGNRTLGGSLIRQMGWFAFIIRTPRFLIVDRLIPEIGKNAYYIQHLATRERFRGQGIGRSLLEFCEAQAVGRRLGCLMLDVESANTAAIGLYQSFGFTITRKISSRVFRRKYNFEGLYRMVKEIKKIP
jgi:ribosomal protein S18 acetylase RimI-like enzyme